MTVFRSTLTVRVTLETYCSCFGQKKALDYMNKIAECDTPKAQTLKHAALYNLGQAYLEGYSVKHSDAEAER